MLRRIWQGTQAFLNWVESWGPANPHPVASEDRREPLALYRTVLDEVSAAWLVSVGGRIFPAAAVRIALLARNIAEAAQLRHLFADGGRFEHDLRSRLANIECRFDPRLRVEIDITQEDNALGTNCRYVVEYAEAVKQGVGRAWLELTRGGAPCSFPLRDHPVVISVGRLPQVADADGREIRENDIVLNGRGVSRMHGHFRWEPSKQECTYSQDELLNCTEILRESRAYRVSTMGDPFVLLAGDRVHIGGAIIQFLAEHPGSRTLEQRSPDSTSPFFAQF